LDVSPFLPYAWTTLYTGRESDNGTGLYYYRARYYDATIGTFVGRDPIGYRGGINLYEYCGDDPLDGTDPYGTRVAHCRKPGTGGTVAGHYGRTPDQDKYIQVPDTWKGGAPCPAALGEKWYEVGLTADQGVVCSSCCKGNPTCEKSLATLMSQVENVPSQSGGNKCFKWAEAFLGNYPSYDGTSPITLPGGITVEPLNVPTKDPNGVVTYRSCFGIPVRRYYDHCVFRVKCPSEKTVYFDIGSNTDLGNFGGPDHWWYPNSPEDDMDYYLDMSRTCPYKCGDYKK
jgi:RHS repeat-associated protein